MLLILFLTFNQGKAQIADQVYRIDSLIENTFNAKPYTISMDSMTLLLEGNKTSKLYFFYDRTDNRLIAIQDEGSHLSERITFFFHKNELIGVDMSRKKDSLTKFFYFFGKDTYLKEGVSYKRTDGAFLKTLAAMHSGWFHRKN